MYLLQCVAAALRSSCLRKGYGAIIVKEVDGIVTGTYMGYNGSAIKHPNCNDIGYCQRSEQPTPNMSKYEYCRAIHAEENAVIKAGSSNSVDATLFLFGYDKRTNEIVDVYPCENCMNRIYNVGIKKLVCLTPNNIAEYTRQYTLHNSFRRSATYPCERLLKLIRLILNHSQVIE